VQPQHRRTLLIVGAHLLLGLLFLAPGYIRPDSVAVFAWLRSALFDGDLLFFNEWQAFGMIVNGATSFKEVTHVGTLANHWWVGTSIVAAPAYLVATAVATLLRFPGGGFFGLYAATLAWCSVAFTAIAMLLIDRMSAGRGRERLLVAAAILFGTPLFWYTFRFPLGTHAAGTMAVTVLVWLLLQKERLEPNSYLIGLAAGLATACRLQHVLLIAAVVTLALVRRASLRFYLRCAAGFAVVMLTQAIAWWIVYGSPFGPLTSGANLGGVTWMPFHSLRLLPVLLSSYHGLFSWSPVTLLSIVGLLLALRSQNREMAIVLLAAFAGELIANSALDRYFWGGFSFGPRRFVDLAAVFAIGLSWFLQLVRPRLIAMLMVPLAVIWSAGLTIAAMSNQLELSRYVSSADLVAAFTEAFLPPWPLPALRSPITDLQLLGHSLAAIAILVALAATIWTMRRFLTTAATVYLLACSLLLAGMWRPTRAKALDELVRFRVDPTLAARWGPLSDQRRLLQDELDFLRAEGQGQEAAATEQEIRQIDAALRQLWTSNQVH
jgi:hypothetical protein